MPGRPSAPRAKRPAPAPHGANKNAPTKQSGNTPDGHAPGAVVTVKRIFAAESANYFLLLGTTIFLVAFGLVMVLSSSSIESYVKNDSDSFASFMRQGLYAIIGIPLMLVVSLIRPAFWKKWAWLALGFALALQLLVFTGLGGSGGGNRNWVNFGFFQAQPSELIKLALIVWMGYVLSRKAALLDDWRHVLLPIGPVAALAILLVLGGDDLGTAIIMLFIVFGALFLAGIKLQYLLFVGTIISAFGIAFAFSGGSRARRITAWIQGCPPDDPLDSCWQSTHGTWALASGSIFGVGLGNSKAKWSWLPEADNDFIFAIIGEELGLIGAIVVLLLFIVLAISFVRIYMSTTDVFTRVTVSGVMIWVVGQALVNIAVVLGLLPVLGVPLPLISAGGSALISTLIAIGVVLSFARQPREAADAAVGQSPADRSRLAAASRIVR
jgi:cell division protein FtsW